MPRSHFQKSHEWILGCRKWIGTSYCQYESPRFVTSFADWLSFIVSQKFGDRHKWSWERSSFVRSFTCHTAFLWMESEYTLSHSVHYAPEFYVVSDVIHIFSLRDFVGSPQLRLSQAYNLFEWSRTLWRQQTEDVSSKQEFFLGFVAWNWSPGWMFTF